MEQSNTLNYVKQIHGGSESWRIKVKVLISWKAYYRNNPTNQSGVDFIFMDEKGDKIVATIKTKLLSDFQHLVQEGSVCIISNFGVADVLSSFRLVDHDCKINFYKHTSVKNHSEFSCSKDGFDFVKFSDVISFKPNPRLAFDVIGQVIESDDLIVKVADDGKTKPILKCKLLNDNGEKVHCALWDEHALQMQKFITENKHPNGPVVILIQLAKFNDFKGQPQVSNCLFGSRLFINDDHPQITNFLESLKKREELPSNSNPVVQLSSNTVYSNPEDFYLQFQFKNIDEIYEVKTIMGCVMVAKVLKIEHEHGWFYMACRKCSQMVKPNDKYTSKKTPLITNEKLQDLGTKDVQVDNSLQLAVTQISTSIDQSINVIAQHRYKCEDCGYVSDVYPRTKLYLRVQDGTGSVSISIFEREVCRFINRTTSYLVNKYNKQSSFNLYPDEFNIFLNKRFVFKIQVAKYNLDNNYYIYTVNKFTQDENVIKAVLSKALNVGDTNSQGETPLPLPNIQLESKEEVSFTGENGDNGSQADMVVTSTVTPGGKRVVEDTDDEIQMQGSSSKSVPFSQKMKIPKLEFN